jgi:hypothetical protein
VTDDLDQAMQDVLLAMTMLSYGSTSAWDSNGGPQGKPGSRILVLVDRRIGWGCHGCGAWNDSERTTCIECGRFKQVVRP